MRWPRSQRSSPSASSRSSACPGRFAPCPPFTSTAGARPHASRTRCAMARAAASMSSSLAMGCSASTAASGMFGVTIAAIGKMRRTSASIASVAMSAEPLVATMTGSTMMFSALLRESESAITSTIGALDTMPIFTACGRISSNTTSICCSTNAGGTSCTPNTPKVFWAVSAVMAHSANRPWAAMVFTSAWMPAPARYGEHCLHCCSPASMNRSAAAVSTI